MRQSTDYCLPKEDTEVCISFLHFKANTTCNLLETLCPTSTTCCLGFDFIFFHLVFSVWLLAGLGPQTSQRKWKRMLLFAERRACLGLAQTFILCVCCPLNTTLLVYIADIKGLTHVTLLPFKYELINFASSD